MIGVICLRSAEWCDWAVGKIAGGAELPASRAGVVRHSKRGERACGGCLQAARRYNARAKSQEPKTGPSSGGGEAVGMTVGEKIDALAELRQIWAVLKPRVLSPYAPAQVVKESRMVLAQITTLQSDLAAGREVAAAGGAADFDELAARRASLTGRARPGE